MITEKTQTEQSIKQVLRELCLEALGREPGANEELLLPGQDPQDLVYLLSKIQEKFGFEIINKDARGLKNLSQILDFVITKIMESD